MIEVSIEPRQFVAGRDSRLVVRFANSGPGTCTDIVFKLGLPPQFLLLRGRNRIEIAELRAGGGYAHDLIVRPRNAGAFIADSANFSYRNHYDTPVRVSSFRVELSVLPASVSEVGRPALSIEHAGKELVLGEWDVLAVRIRNAGDFPLRSLVLSVSGPIRIAPPGPQVQLAGLGAGEESEVRFVACPAAGGRHVPMHVRTTYADGFGRTRTQDNLLPVVVTRQEAPASRARSGNGAHRLNTILYLAASPTDMPPLRSDKEMREIREELQLGKYRERFRLESHLAVRLRDIGQALVDYDPRIVHFSGHGERDGSLYIEDELGCRIPVPPDGLAALFKLHAATVDCVIVNACHTMLLAKAMTRYIDHVIAMRCEIGDVAAITFSIGFYQGLAGGASVAEAFERGCAFLQAQPMGKSEHDTPVLLKKTAASRPEG